jgi:hypothetical protein
VKDWRVVNGLFVGTTILQGLSFGHTMAYLPLYLAQEIGLSRPRSAVGPASSTPR